MDYVGNLGYDQGEITPNNPSLEFDAPHDCDHSPEIRSTTHEWGQDAVAVERLIGASGGVCGLDGSESHQERASREEAGPVGPHRARSAIDEFEDAEEPTGRVLDGGDRTKRTASDER